MLETLLFWVFAALGIAGGIGLIINRNPVYSALSLILNFFSIAGLYLALSAEFLAAIQILVYAGAIMVLFLFVIMLLNLQEEKIEMKFDFRRGLAFILGIAFIAEMFFVFTTLHPFTDDEVETLDRKSTAYITQLQKREKEVQALSEEELENLPEPLLTHKEEVILKLQKKKEELEAAAKAARQKGEDKKAKKLEEKAKSIHPVKVESELVHGMFGMGEVEPIGKQLMTSYLFPFEMISVILLSALIGAIVVARKHTYE